MTEQEAVDHAALIQIVRSALSALRLSRIESEDIEAAKARLENWLTENDGRWVK